LPKVPTGGNERRMDQTIRPTVPSVCPAGIPAHPSVTPLMGFGLNPGFRLGRPGVLVSPVRELLNPSKTVRGPPRIFFAAASFNASSYGKS
jgi:hypothetical protein